MLARRVYGKKGKKEPMSSLEEESSLSISTGIRELNA
jgi:hypothetical protein